MPPVHKGVHFLVGHGPPPVIALQRLAVNIRIVAADTEWKRPFRGGNQLRYRQTVARNEHLFAFEHTIQEFGKLGFGVVDVIAGHARMLAHVWD